MKRIAIAGEIWDENPDLQVIIDAIDSGEDIELIISSYGGDLNHALAVYKLLKPVGDKVTAKVIGKVASAATVILLSADKRIADQDAELLIHFPSTELRGTADELEETAIELRKYESKLKEIYSGIAGAETLLKEERWLTAKEALEAGLITEIEQTTPLSALKRALVLNSINNKLKTENLKTIKNVTNMEEVEVLKQEIEQLKADKAELIQENEQLKQRLEALVAELESLKNEDAEAEVEAAIHAGKISASAKEDAIMLAKKDLTSFRKLMNYTKVEAIKAEKKTFNKEELKKAWKEGKISSSEYAEKIKNL
jgi:ATP-dependent protease ClpP protease subunit